MSASDQERSEVYTTRPPGPQESSRDLAGRLEAWAAGARARRLIRALRRAGVGGAWLVGGTVRDLALGRAPEPPDLDLAVTDRAAEAAGRIAEALGGSPFVLDEEREAWRVALEGGGTVDVIPLRASTIREDLAGRDFTVNALAWDLLGPGALLDPLGGLADLADRVLRLCRPLALEEDPVRVLRAYRFSVALGLRPAEGLGPLMARAARGLPRAAPERVRTELFLTLGLPGGAGALRRMHAHGVLEALFPFVTGWRGFDQGDYHSYDLLEHSLRAAEEAQRLAATGQGLPGPGRLREHLSEELEQGITRGALLVLAAFLHDLAKPECAAVEGERRRFIGHEVRGGHLLRKLLEGLRVGRRARGAAQRVVAAHLRLFQLARQSPATGRARLRYLRDLRSEVPEALILSLADERATGPEPPSLEAVERTAAEVLALYWRKRDQREIPPLIRGRDLVERLGVPPGPRVGALLRAVEEAEARGEVATPNEALALARRLIRGP